jgi:hypothetical protein
MDAENDRLTFKLQQPYEGPNSYAAYSLNNLYSVSVPIKTFTGVGTTDSFAKVNRNIFPPRGFSFDSLTGLRHNHSSTASQTYRFISITWILGDAHNPTA